jgi:hypothetical protein
MKRSFVLAALTAFATLMFCISTAGAQTPKEFKASERRVDKILKLEPPKPCGMKTVDGYLAGLFGFSRTCAKVGIIIKIYRLDPTAENKAKAIAAIEDEDAAAEAMFESMAAPYEASAAEGKEKLTAQLTEQMTAEYEALSEEQKAELNLWKGLSMLNYMMKVMKLLAAEGEFHEKVAETLKGE